MKYNIVQYESINLECQQLRKAILEIKKGYSTKKNEIQNEKDKISTSRTGIDAEVWYNTSNTTRKIH